MGEEAVRAARMAKEDARAAKRYRRWSYWLKTVSIALPALVVIGGIAFRFIDWPFETKEDARRVHEELRQADIETRNVVQAVNGKLDILIQLLQERKGRRDESVRKEPARR